MNGITHVVRWSADPVLFDFIKYLWNSEAYFPGCITYIGIVHAVLSICEMMVMFALGLAYS